MVESSLSPPSFFSVRNSTNAGCPSRSMLATSPMPPKPVNPNDVIIGGYPLNPASTLEFQWVNLVHWGSPSHSTAVPR